WDLDNPQVQRPPPEPKKPAEATLPADLPNLKPVTDHDFSDSSKSPFVSERGPSPMVNSELKLERHFGRETVYLFHARPKTSEGRCLFDCQRQTFTNFACRLTGRTKSRDLAAISLWLGESPSWRCLGVQVW